MASVTSCVTDQRPATSSRYYTPDDHPLIPCPTAPVPLRAPSGGSRGLLFDVSHVFAIEEESQPVPLRRQWRVSTRLYQRRLLDQVERELLVYHWQPGDDFLGPDHPHLQVAAALAPHLNAPGAAPTHLPLAGRHLATGRVSLEAFIRMLIEAFGVEPRRSDWGETLTRTEAVFRADATSRI